MAIRYIAHLQSVLSAPDSDASGSSTNGITTPTYYNQSDSTCNRLWRLTVNICFIFDELLIIWTTIGSNGVLLRTTDIWLH